MVHGTVEGQPDLRIKGVIDDGTGAISVILGREPTQELLGKELEWCVEQARERMGTEFVREELIEKLVARPLVVEGNVTSDDFGLTMIGRRARVLDIDVKLEAQKLLEEMGV
jgi:replication factor A1